MADQHHYHWVYSIGIVKRHWILHFNFVDLIKMVVILLSKVRLSVTHVEQGMPKVTNPVAQTCMTANKWRQNPLGLSMSLDHGQFIKPVCGGYTHIHACCDRHMWALGITVHASIDTNNPCRQNHYKTKIQDGVKRLHEQPNGNFPLCLPKKYFSLGFEGM